MQNHNLGRESSDRYVPTSSAASNQRPPPLSSDIMPSRQEVSSGGGPQGRPQGIYNPQHMGHPTSVRHQNGFDVTAASTKAVTTVNSEASVVVPKTEMQDNDKTGVDEPKKLTKSQKAKLRKKLREGKA